MANEQLSVSVGALLATSTDTAATLLQRAEAQLQRARIGGGNQVVLAEDTGW